MYEFIYFNYIFTLIFIIKCYNYFIFWGLDFLDNRLVNKFDYYELIIEVSKFDIYFPV